MPSPPLGRLPWAVYCLCRSECLREHALAQGGALLVVCSPCCLATQVVERVRARVRTHIETTLLTESRVAVSEVERSLRDARRRG